MSIYEGKIKVVGDDKICFPVHPRTLEALSTGGYDPYPHLPGQGAIEVISFSEWQARRNRRFREQQRAYYKGLASEKR